MQSTPLPWKFLVLLPDTIKTGTTRMIVRPKTYWGKNTACSGPTRTTPSGGEESCLHQHPQQSSVQAKLHAGLLAQCQGRSNPRLEVLRCTESRLRPTTSGSTPLFCADGSTLLTGKKQILERLTEQFNSVLNRPTAINDEVIVRLPQIATDLELDAPFSIEEVNKAIKHMTSGKAPCPNVFPAEEFEPGGETICNQLTSLFQTMWNQEHLPQEFSDATIVHVYKRKGNRQCCDNHR